MLWWPVGVSAPPPVRPFIGASSEGVDVAHHRQAVGEDRVVCEVEVGDQDVFEPPGYALDSLLEAAGRFDFAVLVASPNDMTTSRGDPGEGKSASNPTASFGRCWWEFANRTCSVP